MLLNRLFSRIIHVAAIILIVLIRVHAQPPGGPPDDEEYIPLTGMLPVLFALGIGLRLLFKSRK